MIKKISMSIITASVLMVSNLSASQFTLSINGKSHPIQIDKQTKLKINGKMVNIKLIENQIQKYKLSQLSFEYMKDIKPSTQKINQMIKQTTLNTAFGNIIMVQEYKTNITDDMIFPLMKKQFSSNNFIDLIDQKNINTYKTLSNGDKIFGVKYNTINQNTDDIKKETQFYIYNNKGYTTFIAIIKQSVTNDVDKDFNKVQNLFWKSLKFK